MKIKLYADKTSTMAKAIGNKLAAAQAARRTQPDVIIFATTQPWVIKLTNPLLSQHPSQHLREKSF
ncbi:MAG: hypothetical protein KBF98_08405 [Rhodoferax sp.]|nr:hypothetical protein [Rhodoferax sp.]MBP9060322.1 hypothetical protein [Rhodoferax sp.]MBP9683982.1 hypothetical protein [Rhodoferax sp.]